MWLLKCLVCILISVAIAGLEVEAQMAMKESTEELANHQDKLHWTNGPNQWTGQLVRSMEQSEPQSYEQPPIERQWLKRQAYTMGLGKRQAYTMGLGKRDPYAMGLGKREAYTMGLGKREAYTMGLGK